jgi:cysteine-rich repeat protein
MNHVGRAEDMRMYRPDIAAIVAIFIAVMVGACLPDTRTIPCEKSSLRCPPGYSCSADQNTCIPNGCGDGIVSTGEQCDDGNVMDGDGCDSNCTMTSCDNGILTAGEVCDDGNVIDGDGCDNNCTMTGCNNGILTTGEMCDDGNATCGTCNDSCAVFASAQATGAILVADSSTNSSGILDGDIFTLDDGINNPVVFEFVRDGMLNDSSRIPINIGMDTSVSTIRDAIFLAISDAAIIRNFLIDPSTENGSKRSIKLTHRRFTNKGNIQIVGAVQGLDFTGMSGGAGGDCKNGQTCRSNADCVSNVCLLDNTCGA